MHSRHPFPLPYSPQHFSNNTCAGVAHPDIITGLKSLINLEKREFDRKLLPGQGANLIWEASLSPSESFPWPRQAIKEFSRSGVRNLLTSLFKKSKAMKSYLNACHLLKNGLLTPMPLGVLEHRKMGFILKEAYISEKIDNIVNMDELMKSSFDIGPEEKEVVRLLADYIRSMHDCGFWHRDLNSSNFLLTGNPGSRQLYLVDLNRGRIVKDMSKRLRILELSRLTIKKWRPMFFEYYCAGRFDPQKMLASSRRIRKTRKFWRERIRKVNS